MCSVPPWWRGSLRALVCVRIVRERIAGNLSKDDLIDMQGTVVAVHSGGLYRVQCDAGHDVHDWRGKDSLSDGESATGASHGAE